MFGSSALTRAGCVENSESASASAHTKFFRSQGGIFEVRFAGNLRAPFA